MSDYNPSIYAGCLASYNAGQLHGRWISALQSVEEIEQEIQAMLAASPVTAAEEWEIFDYEDFGPFQDDTTRYLGGLSAAHEVADFLCEHGDLGATLIVDGHCSNIAEATEVLEEYYHGAWQDELTFAEHLFDECYADQIPESIRFYIDYEQFKYDIFIGDFFSVWVDGEAHIFGYH